MSTALNLSPQPGQCWRTRHPDRTKAQHWRITGIEDGAAVLLHRESDGRDSSASLRAFTLAFEPCTQHPPLPQRGGTP